LTRAARSSDLWKILLSRIPLQELQATRIDQLQVQRQTFLYDGIVSWFENLLSARAAAEAARKFLLGSGLISNPSDLADYTYFAGYASFILASNPATAKALISALYSEFTDWGFSPSILQSLLTLQNISL